MSLQIVGGIVLIVIGMGGSIFAERIFDISQKLLGSLRFDQWPAWMTPTRIWLMRIGGFVLAVCGFILIINNK